MNHDHSDDQASDQGQWSVFERRINNQIAIALIDTAAFQDGPVRELPVFIAVSIPLRADKTSDNGLPSSEELNRIAPVEDAVIEALDKLGARNVAMLLHNGTRTIYFFARSESGISAAAHAAARAVSSNPPHEIAVRTKNDPQWASVEEFMPTAEEVRWAGDQDVIAQLADAGDPCTEAREIEHYAYFPSIRAAETFHTWLIDHGFTPIEITPGSGKEPALVRFSHTGIPEIADIFEHTSAATRAAEALGGDYDGWEARVLR